MTLEELLGLSRPVSELTDTELAAHCAQFLPHTRPRKPANYLHTQVQEKYANNSRPAVSELAAKMQAEFAARGMDSAGRPIVKKKLNINQL